MYFVVVWLQRRNCQRMSKCQERVAAAKDGDWQRAKATPRLRATVASDGAIVSGGACASLLRCELIKYVLLTTNE